MIIFTNKKDRTEENIILAENYDFYIGAIDNGRQYREAKEFNNYILHTLAFNGVKEVMFKYVPMMSSTETEIIIDLTKDI